MKAIYINIDPYLSAFASWLKGATVDPDTGETDTPPPRFDTSIPLAVTLPLGEECVVFVPYGGTADDPQANAITIGGVTFYLSGTFAGTEVATNLTPGLSAVGPATKYAAVSVSGDSATVMLSIAGRDDVGLVEPAITVLVRREQASGPVDLVDFTPPVSAIAAGTDLKGCKFDGNEIVAAKTTGALSAPAGA